jgi:hypothetical protein
MATESPATHKQFTFPDGSPTPLHKRGPLPTRNSSNQAFEDIVRVRLNLREPVSRVNSPRNGKLFEAKIPQPPQHSLIFARLCKFDNQKPTSLICQICKHVCRYQMLLYAVSPGNIGRRIPYVITMRAIQILPGRHRANPYRWEFDNQKLPIPSRLLGQTRSYV